MSTEAPSINGQATDGQLLTADRGEWSGDTPIEYAYEWKRCDSSGAACESIAGASAKTYGLRPADVGRRLRVTVTAQNAKGSASAESAPTPVVSAAPPANVDPPSVSGTAEVGQTLTGHKGAWTGTPEIQYGWQWRRCDTNGASCADIAGASGPSYQLGAEDEAATLRIEVTATNAAGSVSAASAPTAPVSGSSGGPRSNAPPVADFVFFPAQPIVGQQIDLVSISSDPDGSLAQQEWDLDDDGQFDDASGVRTTQTFSSAGAHTVRLRVTDQDGAVDVRSQVIEVSAPPPSAPPPPSSPPPASAPPPESVGTAPQSPGPAPSLAQSLGTPALQPQPPLLAMSPAATVRIVGQLTRGGVRLRLVYIRAPRGAKVEVRCRGGLCPLRRLLATAKTGRLRLKRLEALLGVGARLEVFVRQPGHVGKYTRFRVRGRKLPARLDACLTPGASRPTPCPGP